MGRTFPVCLLGMALSAPSTSRASQPEGFEAEIRKRVPLVRRWAADPVVVATVARANARASSMEEIRARDQRWQETSGIDEFMRSLLDNDCAKRLRRLGKQTPELAEAFVTDRWGANVAMTRKTSDFWQGDEAKFQKAFTGGSDSFHIDPVSFDESIQAYAVQISVPVVSAGSPIGVLVTTLNLENLEAAEP